MAQTSFDQRKRENEILKENGYRWQKQSDGSWQLFDPAGDPIEKHIAFQQINTNTIPKTKPVFDHTHRLSMIRLAQAILLANPVFLDTETTGKTKTDHAIDIAVVDAAGTILVDSLIQTDREIDPDAIETHHITPEMLVDAPTFPNLWKVLEPILTHRPVVIYNSAFDVAVLETTASASGLNLPKMQTHCLMWMYATFYGELLPGSSQYRNKKLSEACDELLVVPGHHRALADAEAARRVLVAMARAEI